ncbi:MULTISPECIES: hypothetical protein [unclassified Pseudomonas]|uniref:hypothetical protein n=1 Tax=unclassified Pseudomonas TaxID=196821 RepID=UPI000F5811C2|nr:MULTISPECIES: hypothetical protein [unclassified Pseudomonas]AZF24519.1 hypothetical protein C4J90_0314 [Pseudomonas sp. R2-60-08W]MCS4314476.1 hypothetical protein [Pseudomonas sp. BIGb0381]
MSWIDYAQGLLDKSWLGTLLGIAGIVFAACTYLWTRKRTSLAYVHLGEHLLGSASDALPSQIVVQYNGISIPRLTKSILIFWNSGENTVNGEDIVAKDPLRFQVGDDGQILSAAILKSSRAVNDFSILKTPDIGANEITFSFNFLDKDDGVVVEILHTSTDRKPRVKGTLKGLPQGFRNLGQFIRPKPQKSKPGKLHPLGSTLLPIGVALSGFLTAIYGPRPSFLANPDTLLLFYSFLGVVVGMWLNSRFWNRRKYPKSLHTEALE